MDTSKTTSLIDRLDDEIDDLEEALEPMTATPLVQKASTMPVLDKAKLYVLSAYAIESMLFSYLRLNSVDAKDHPVFKELARVRQYFEKLKRAEGIESKPELRLDKEAAARFIKAGLSGNDKLDAEQAERIAKERVIQARAAAKKKAEAQEAAGAAEEADPDSESESSKSEPDGQSDSVAPSTTKAEKSKGKKRRKDTDTAPDSETGPASKKHKSKSKKSKDGKKSKSKSK